VATSQNNYLAALVPEGTAVGLAYLDASTGYLAASELSGAELSAILAAELCRIGPSECLLSDESAATGELESLLPSGCRVTRREAGYFGQRRAAERLWKQFSVQQLAALGMEDVPLAARAGAALLEYVAETLPDALRQFNRIERYDPHRYMVLDPVARRNLELVAGLRGNGRAGSLLEVIDSTQTPMGCRLLRNWVAQPLLELEAIAARQEVVEKLARQPARAAALAEQLKGMPDLERLAGRAYQGRLGPRDCLALVRGLERAPNLGRELSELGSRLSGGVFDGVPEIAELVTSRLADDPPVAVGPGTVRTGYSASLDEGRSLGGDTRRWIADLERRERERTGVKSLRVGHNRVFGYYLEVSQAATRQATDYYQRQQSGAEAIGPHLEQLGYVRKQTLAGAERYITQELKEFELRASRAEQEVDRLERQLFRELLEAIQPYADRVKQTSGAVATLDCLVSLAEAGKARGYVRPELVDSRELTIEAGRHPTVEASLGPGEFVPNDLLLSSEGVSTLVVTGPNMAGKSTYLRQAALITVLAQIGSFVPAERARVGLVDRIFTRIGAQDDVSGHRSTFMVEMTEAASILRNSTPRSLVILDEVGRGTSTYDGMALARAILEHLTVTIGCRTLFATHYHELAELERQQARIGSARMEVLEHGREVVFLHRVVPGGADRSYGIQVARLAGVPTEITARAEEILVELESDGRSTGSTMRLPATSEQRLAFDIVDQLRVLDVTRLTPMQALARLEAWQARLGARSNAT
jgi:DNA mismatch repair protein MutS